MVHPLLLMMVLGAGPSRAESLFLTGRKLLEQQQYAAACAVLEESLAAEATLGTLLNLGECQEKLGHPVEAWNRFEAAALWAGRVNDAVRREVAEEHAKRLAPKVSRLRVDAPPDASLSLDGKPWPAPSSLEVAVAPGEHTVTALVDEGVRTATVTVGPPPAAIQVDVRPKRAGAPPAAPPTPPPAPVARLVPPPAPIAPAAVALSGGQVATSSESPRAAWAPWVIGAGAALAIVGGIGIAYSWDVKGRVDRQQPGGADFANPTVTRSQYSQLSWVYPLSIGGAAVGVGAVAFGLHLGGEF